MGEGVGTDEVNIGCPEGEVADIIASHPQEPQVPQLILRIPQLIEELEKMMDENYPPGNNVHKIESGREEARKKYNVSIG